MHPFPSRTLAAVGACARALGADDNPESALAGASSATLGALRAHSDRLALGHRFHDSSAHHQYRPNETAEANLYDDLEYARLDALGARWLTGIAKNLVSHPGANDDGARWLAFGLLSGLDVPPVKTEMVDRARAALSPALLEQLSMLAAHIDDSEGFAAAASAWARSAATALPAPRSAVSVARPALPTRTLVRERPFRGDPGGTRAPLRQKTDATSSPEEAEPAGSGARVQPGSGGDDYRVFTTAHDRVVTASALAHRQELAKLRISLQDDLVSMRSIIARLAKRLLRVLMAQQARGWQFDLDEGLLDGSRLASLVASRGRARPFKQELDSPFPSTVVTLLIDHSGSMRGRPMQIAALTVEIFARVLERCGVRCEVLGFTTRDWDGGEPAREWAASGYPEGPGRLNALEHIIVKSADVPWRRARVGLGLFLRDEMLKENIDGEAVEWAHSRLQARHERRRILVVVSDGTPMDEATLATNGHDYLDRHLADVVERIETRSHVQMAAIGIGHDVSRFYRRATRIRRVDDLGPALTVRLIDLLGEGGLRPAERPAGPRMPRRRRLQ
jgi:cobaltochelatase CobT